MEFGAQSVSCDTGLHAIISQEQVTSQKTKTCFKLDFTTTPRQPNAVGMHHTYVGEPCMNGLIHSFQNFEALGFAMKEGNTNSSHIRSGRYLSRCTKDRIYTIRSSCSLL